jgi:hypothetical protein
MFLTFLRAMGFKSLYNSGKDAAEKLENVQETQGFDEVEKVTERLGLKKQTDRALELKDAASENFLDKKELAAETREDAEKKPWWRRGLKWAIGGGFGLLLGKELLGGKEEEIVEETVDQGLDIVTDEEKLRQTNDTFKAAIEAERAVKEVHKEVDEKWKFKKEKQEKDWFVELEKKEKKYAKYGHKDAWKEAWEKTEYEYDPETGEQTKKRNFFFRLFAFFPALTKTYAGWRSFEALKKSGAIEKIKKGKEYKDRAEKKVHEAEEEFNKGVEAKREGFEAVFAENPGAMKVFFKRPFDGLKKIFNKAEKLSPVERANGMTNVAEKTVAEGARKYGKEFVKSESFKKRLPWISVKERGGFLFVEIIGKSLGAALREGAEEGGWARAGSVFKQEILDANNWKDACPVWGTIRSFNRLSVDDDVPRWSKWLDFGLSAGMDVATGVGIVASLGTLSAPLLAARTAAGAAAKGGVRKMVMKQLLRQGVRGGEKFAEKEFTKESRKGFTKNVLRTAGGKWGVRMQLMMTTIGEFFGDDVEEITTEVKHEAYNTLLTSEQRYAIALEKAARSGAPLPEREAILAEEDKKQKEEITVDEEKQSAGILSTTSQKGGEEGKEKKTKTVSLSAWQKKNEKKKQKEEKKKVLSEEKTTLMAA